MKEDYFYLDSTPTHSYLKALYKYPQAEFPYARLVEENRRRARQRAGVRTGRHRRLRRTTATSMSSPNTPRTRPTTSSSASPSPIAGRTPRTLHLLPTLWFRNTWTWGCDARRLLRSSRALRWKRTTVCRSSTKRSALFLRDRPRSRRPACRRCFSPTTKPIARGCSARPTHGALRQGRLPRIRHPRPQGRGEPARTSAPRPRRITCWTLKPGRIADASGCGCIRPRQRTRRRRSPPSFDEIVRAANARGR